MRSGNLNYKVSAVAKCGQCGLRVRKVYCFLTLSLFYPSFISLRARTSRIVRSLLKRTFCLPSSRFALTDGTTGSGSIAFGTVSLMALR